MPAHPGDAHEIRRFEEQYSENPDSFVFARLADAYRKAGDPERALALLREGLARHPTYLSARIVHARVLRELDRTDEAADAYARVLELDGQNMVAVRGLAEIAREREDHEAARRWLARLSAIESLDREVRTMLRELDGGDRDGREDGDSGMEASPEPRAAAGEGADAEAEGDAGGGQRDIGAGERDVGAGERDGGFATATLADLYLAQGLHEEASAIYLRLLEARPGDPALAGKLREAWEKAGRDPESLPARARPSRTAAAATGEGGGPGTGAADGAPRPADGGARVPQPDAREEVAAAPPDGTAEATTARELLVALLEGRADVPRAADGERDGSPFRDWLARSGGR